MGLVLALLLLLGPAIAHAQLAIGSRIQTTQVTAVRDAPGGTSLGLQPIGAQGIVLAGPQSAWGFAWWQIHYDAGLDGWSTDDRLTLAAGPPPLPGMFSAPRVTRRDVAVWTIGWIAPANAKTVEIERGLSATGPFAPLTSQPAMASPYQDFAVVNGATYCYRLRASNSMGPSIYSGVTCRP